MVGMKMSTNSPEITYPARNRRVKYAVPALVLVALLSFAGTAAAAPTSIETTTTFIGRNKRRTPVGTGTSRSQLIAIIKKDYGNPTVNLTGFSVKVNGKNYKLTAAERKQIQPKINYGLMADTVLKASKQKNATTELNPLVLNMINKKNINTVVSAVQLRSEVQALNMRYQYNSKKKRLTVKSSKPGSRITAAAGRKAVNAALVQFATKGYRGSVATTNIKRARTAASLSSRKRLGKAILINRGERRLYLYNKGKLVRSYAVTVGKPGYATALGDYYIGAKRKNPIWRNPGSSWASSMGPTSTTALGVRAMNLMRASNGSDSLLRIHGQRGTAGQAASHGCVRLSNTEVVKLFDQVPSGTPVYIRK
jgi:lipoprotein-anchoring transpeptidase ErfK/SrfK